MSNSNNLTSQSYSSFSSSSYSSSRGTDGQQQNFGTRSQTTSHTDPSGKTTVNTLNQNLGEPVQRGTRHYDAQGRELVGGPEIGGASNRIEEAKDETEADKLYRDRMEDEYAKREGGA